MRETVIEWMIQKIYKKKMADIPFFYVYFRPLAILCMFCGTFPLTNMLSSNGKHVKSRFWSLVTVWTMVHMGALSFIVYYCDWIIIVISYFKVDLWKIILGVVIFLQGVIQFCFVHHYAKHFPKLIHSLEEVYTKKRQIFPDSSQLTFLTWMVFPVFCSVCIFAAIAGVLWSFTQYFDSSNQGIFLTLMFFIIALWQYFPLILFIYFSYIIAQMFRDIRVIVQHILEPVSKLDEIKDVAELDGVRLLHSLLSLAVKKMDICYGNIMAMNYIVVQVVIVIDLYVYLVSHMENNDFVPFSFVIINGLFVFYTSSSAQDITNSAHAVLEDLKSVPLSKLSSNAQSQVHIFMSQIMADPVQISAAGYFVVGKTQITSILSSVATYLIVMIQFSPYIQDGTFIQG